MPVKKSQKTSSSTTSLWKSVRDNYTSLIVGLVSLIVIGVVIYKYLPLHTPFQKVDTVTTTTVTSIPAPSPSASVYIVQPGDSLWKIAEEYYGSGYNAYDIAAGNQLTNANSIDIGQKLVIPSLTQKPPTAGEITATAAQTERVKSDVTSYIVKYGDSLWSIAVLIYGDGDQWTRIAQANNLMNPDFIHVGNVLQIPGGTGTK